jgi:hypothetical protein
MFWQFPGDDTDAGAPEGDTHACVSPHWLLLVQQDGGLQAGWGIGGVLLAGGVIFCGGVAFCGGAQAPQAISVSRIFPMDW